MGHIDSSDEFLRVKTTTVYKGRRDKCHQTPIAWFIVTRYAAVAQLFISVKP